jgi:signal transduction histidine kinase
MLLLRNAIKFSPVRSEVTIQVEQRREGMAIAVVDHGLGIDAADASRVFEKHQRGQTTEPGLGLGLYIVRRIVELHGGRATLDSKSGQGATFSILLPVGPTA